MWVVSCPQFSFLWKQCPVPTHGVFHPWPTLHVGDNIFFLILYWSKMPSVTTQGGICWVELWQKASLLSTLCLNLTFSSVLLTTVQQDYLGKKKSKILSCVFSATLCLFCYFFFCFFLRYAFLHSSWETMLVYYMVKPSLCVYSLHLVGIYRMAPF